MYIIGNWHGMGLMSLWLFRIFSYLEGKKMLVIFLIFVHFCCIILEILTLMSSTWELNLQGRNSSAEVFGKAVIRC